MLIIKEIKQIENQLFKLKNKGFSIGFVPTMGALHSGHLSLINQSKKKCKITVCSIFINPTQFNDPSDFQKYPVTIDQDIHLLTQKHCDILFLPEVKEMYPNGNVIAKKYDFGALAETLEGEFRPGHFDGMAHIVSHLLEIVKPDHLFMGQKDLQQALIIQKMIALSKSQVQLHICATKREESGLAMSSRNTRLDNESLDAAKDLHACLLMLKTNIKNGTLKNENEAIQAGKVFLQKNSHIKIEYIAWRKTNDLLPVLNGIAENSALLIAAWVAGVRLIDNLIVG
jgi:pantoate--beta-alanine ligase